MEKPTNNSQPSSLIEIVELFGKNGEFHKDVSKLSDSIESLVNALGKKSTNKPEQDSTPRTLAGDWKDFKQELKKSLFDDPKQYLGMKKNVKKKENEDLRKEASEKGNLKENNIVTKEAVKIVDKDQSSTILSDMVDVLKLIKEDKTQLKIYEDIVELKKTIKNLNDISAKTIEPNDEEAKQEDREKLAEAIARRLSDVIGESGGFGPDGVIPDKSGKGTGKDKPKPPSGSPGKAAGALDIAGKVLMVGLLAQAGDELAGLLGVNNDSEGKRLGEYPQQLDDIQEQQIKIISGFYSKVGAVARAQEKVHGVIGLNETQQAEKRQRVEKEYVLINEGIKNLDKNTDLSAEDKKKLLELEKQRQALLPKKTEVAPPPSPERQKEIDAAKAEEDAAKEATAKLKNKNSNNEVKPAAAVATVEAAPAKVESKASIESEPFYKVPQMPEDAGQIEADSTYKGELKPLIKSEYNPVEPKPGITANSDKLSGLTEENFNLSMSNNESSQSAPLIMSSNKTINNKETNSIGDKITPYPMYATFDRWQDKRSWGYDHV